MASGFLRLSIGVLSMLKVRPVNLLLLATLGWALLAGGCASSTANYPPLQDPFGKVSHIEGRVDVSRNGEYRQVHIGASIFVGDTVLAEEFASIGFVLAPGQRVRLSAGAIWEITDVISNGAAFGSDTKLEQGLLEVSGDEYMPHRMIVRTNDAEITTYSENFSVSVKGDESIIQSLDNTEIRVNNAKGHLVLDKVNDVVIVTAGSAPRRP